MGLLETLGSLGKYAAPLAEAAGVDVPPEMLDAYNTAKDAADSNPGLVQQAMGFLGGGDSSTPAASSPAAQAKAAATQAASSSILGPQVVTAAPAQTPWMWIGIGVAALATLTSVLVITRR